MRYFARGKWDRVAGRKKVYSISILECNTANPVLLEVARFSNRPRDVKSNLHNHLSSLYQFFTLR